MKIIAFIFITLIIPSVSIAEGSYRDESPVIDPPKPLQAVDLVTPAIKSFESRYRVAGKPRIALFWNIELSDSLKDKHIKTEKVKGSTTKSVNTLEKTTTGPEGTAKLTDGDDKSNFSITRTEYDDQITTGNKRSTTLSESDMWKAQTAFMNTMRKAGVKFIDRNSILRTTALNENTENLPALETKALIGKANLLMEVLMTKDVDAPLGWGFKVSLRDLKSGEEKDSIYTQAHPMSIAPAQSQFKATNNGFEKLTYQKQATVNDVGIALAVDVMNNMRSVLNYSK